MRHFSPVSLLLYVLGGILGGLCVVGLRIGFEHARPPQIIVNMPADAQSLESLKPLPEGTRIVASDRAVLWWTVYDRTLKANFGSIYSAKAADNAVLTVYGPLSSSTSP
jgi:hypothetical protein